MKVWTVTGLVDEESGDLYVAGVYPGKHQEAGTGLTTRMEGYGELSRFTGWFDADNADTAEAVAVDVVRHYADDDAAQWAPVEPRNPGVYKKRKVEDVKTDIL